MHVIKFDRSAAETFLRTMFDYEGASAGFICLAVGIDPHLTPTGMYRHRRWRERYFHPITDREKLLDYVADVMAAEVCDVYVCATLRKGMQRKLKGGPHALVALHADLDGPSGDDELLAALTPVVVDSGSPGHAHVHVMLNQAVEPKVWERLERALVDRLGADSKVADNDLLRLPGTVNHKAVTTGGEATPVTLASVGQRVSPSVVADLLRVGGARADRAPVSAAQVSVPIRPAVPLPAGVRRALENPDVEDRSRAHHRVVKACQDAGMTLAETLAVVADYPPSVEKWSGGDRLVDEVTRSWGKGGDVEDEASGEPCEDGAVLLDEVRAFLARFVAFPSPAALDAVTLWAVHTHFASVLENTPRLALLSPEPGSGKTRTLEVLELLVSVAMFVLNASTAAIFRTLVKGDVTLLFDEVDTIFGRADSDDPSADLRGLLNAGHRRGAKIPRCVGPNHDVEKFPVFCPVALAGLGSLPDTVMSRSVAIRMRRRTADEVVEPFRTRLHEKPGHTLRDRVAAWAHTHKGGVADAWPDLPEGVTDRPADVWEPLLAVADAAGGDWPKIARAACVELVAQARTVDSGSLGMRLLADLRDVFGVRRFLPTHDILWELTKIDGSPWGDMRGKPLGPHALARLLKPYGVAPDKNRVSAAETTRGYHAHDFHESWNRYLPPPTPRTSEHPPHPEQRRSEAPRAVPLRQPDPEQDSEPEQHTPPVTWAVPDVADVPGSGGWGGAAPTCDVCRGVPAVRFGHPHDVVRCAAHNPMTYTESTP